MRFQDEPIMLKPKNPCPVCGAETTLAEIEAHPLHVKFEIHGYLCDRCGPIKSLVVLRPNSRHIDGTLVPVEEPSTASLPDTRAAR
jgi:hypothetical protein